MGVAIDRAAQRGVILRAVSSDYLREKNVSTVIASCHSGSSTLYGFLVGAERASIPAIEAGDEDIAPVASGSKLGYLSFSSAMTFCENNVVSNHPPKVNSRSGVTAPRSCPP